MIVHNIWELMFGVGGWPSAPDGPYAWGYCSVREKNQETYCTPKEWPCPPGKKYYGRGPIQLTQYVSLYISLIFLIHLWSYFLTIVAENVATYPFVTFWLFSNYNYGLAGKAIGEDLINNPDIVATNPTVSFKTAIWFWMTPQANKPSSHDVIIGKWTPSAADKSAGRVPGYGVITNIINGGLECGHGPDAKVEDRIGFYKRYCQILGVSPGDNLDCNNQKSFAQWDRVAIVGKWWCFW